MSASDLELEFKILKSICNSPVEIQGYLLASLKPEHFSTAISQGVFKRILKINIQTNNIPSWQDLRHDPTLRREARAAIKDETSKTLTREDRAKSAFETLERLRKMRALYEVGANLEALLEGDSPDPLDIIASLQNDIRKASEHSGETIVTRMGKSDNAEDVVKRVLSGNGVRRIPTGIRMFDEKNIGFPMGGVVILAANTGGAKSALLDIILHNMAMNGASTSLIPLEMDAEENITRSMSRVTGYSMGQLIDPKKKMSVAQRKDAKRKYRKYRKAMSRRGGCFDIIEPGFSSTIDGLLNYLDPMEYDVVGIDYVGLMDGVNGDDQWRALSNAVAYAKKWAGRTKRKTLVIFAAQLTEEGYLKQSKAMADHASNVWIWKIGEEERESGNMVIDQKKCRGGAVFPIPLKHDLEHMTVRDMTAKELEAWQLASRPDKQAKQGKGAPWKGSGKKKKVEDFDDGEDDEDNEPVKVKQHKSKPRHREY